MGLSVTKHGPVHVLRLSGGLKSGPGVDGFMAEIEKLLTAGYSKFVLVMTEVPHLDSNGIGALVRVYSAARNRDGGVRLVNPTPTAIEILKNVSIWPLFEVSESEQAAVDSLVHSVAAKA